MIPQSKTYSLFTKALCGHTGSRSHRTLNSTAENPRIPQKGTGLPLPELDDFDPSYKPRTEKIFYTRALTGAQFSVELPYLESLTKQNVLEWRLKFLEAAKICGWPDEHTGDYILALTSLSLHKHFDGANSINEMLDRLVAKKYPASRIEFYNIKLSTLSQDNFHDIEDYMEAIDNVLIRWAAASKASLDSVNAKREAIFKQGLSSETRTFMDIHNIQPAESMYARIFETESNIKTRLKEESNNPNNFRTAQRSHGNVPRNHTFQKRYNNQQSNEYFQKPYCRYHKRHGHATEDCYTLKKKRNNSNHDPNNSRQGPQENLSAIQETPFKLKAIEFPIRVENNDIKALVDTGSSRSYISAKLAESLHLPMSKSESFTVSLANSKKKEIKEKCSCTFTILDTNDIKFTVTLHPLKSCHPEIILGLDFLGENRFSCSLGNGQITLNGKYFEIPGFERRDELESLLLENSKLCTVQEESKTKCLRFLNFYKLNNPILGHLKGTEHVIRTENTKPFSSPEYNIPLSKVTETRAEIKRLYDMGIVRPSKSLYFSPAFPIYKKNGSIRLVIDYREMNSRVEHLKFPLPKIQEALASLGGSSYFSQIDLRLGYYQIPMEVQSVKFTAFILDGKVWEFLRMPFGLKNAPHTFQRSITEAFGEFDFVKLYLDDVLIHSRTEEEHYHHLHSFLEKAWKLGLSLNFEKSRFAQRKVCYLGHVISAEGVTSDPSRVQEISFKTPTTKKHISKILGLIQWFRPFVRNTSLKTLFLSELLRKDKKFQWTTNHTEKLNRLVSDIKNLVLLNYPEFDKPFFLQCDASDSGAGAVLFQEAKLLGFFSATWKASERSYSIVEKETYCLVKAVLYFKNIIFGSEIIAYTDNHNTIFSKPLSARSQRWKLLIEHLGISIRHVSGQENKAADALSRICSISEVNSNNLINLEQLAIQQRSLPESLKSNLSPTNVSGFKIYFDSKNRCLVPLASATQFLQKFHIMTNHPGQNGMWLALHNHFYVPNLKNLLKDVTQRCLECQINKSHRSQYGLRAGKIDASSFLELASADLMGPFSSSNFLGVEPGKKLFVFVCLDTATRWTEVEITNSISANRICQLFKNIWLERVGIPRKILTDRGTQFTSDSFRKLCERVGTVQVFTSPYHPEGNGITERLNSVVGMVLRFSIGTDISKLSEEIKKRINLIPDRITQISPFIARFGYSPFDLLQKQQTDRITIAPSIRDVERTKERETFNKNRIQISYSVGDRVYVRNRAIGKLDPRWLGPARICRVGSSGQLKVEHEDISQTISYMDVRPCFVLPERLSHLSEGGQNVVEYDSERSV